MPIDLGLIVDYHYREAARHNAWAEAADQDGNLSEATYHRALAQRYLDAAEEQKRDACLPSPLADDSAPPSAHRRLCNRDSARSRSCGRSNTTGASQTRPAIQRPLASLRLPEKELRVSPQQEQGLLF
jgi:hypothetical protein